MRVSALVFLCAGLLAACSGDGRRVPVFRPDAVTLAYAPEGKRPAAVFVAGTFNNWVMFDPEFKMNWDGAEGEFVARFKLVPGRYEYKFIVDGEWRVDPRARVVIDDPLGGKSAVFQVAER